tara:strand:- start:255 stop:668 length:414 start_codon:yes stop_codon:yes gene_type:complete
MIPVKVLSIGSGTAAIAWMGLIFYLSSLSGAEASQGLESGAVSWLGDLRSYAAHIVLYAVLAALIQVALWGWSLELQLRWVIVAAVLASLFGISDEYHQSFVTGRSATLVDGLVDSIAAFASSTLFWRLVVWYRRVH